MLRLKGSAFYYIDMLSQNLVGSPQCCKIQKKVQLGYLRPVYYETVRKSCKIFFYTVFFLFRAQWKQRRRGAQKNWGMFFEDIYLTCSRLTKLSIAVLCTIAPIVIRRPISPRFFWLHLIWRGKPQKNCFHLQQLITPDQIYT